MERNFNDTMDYMKEAQIQTETRVGTFLQTTGGLRDETKSAVNCVKEERKQTQGDNERLQSKVQITAEMAKLREENTPRKLYCIRPRKQIVTENKTEWNSAELP